MGSVVPTPTKIPTGVFATGAIGTVVIKTDDTVVVTGVSGTGQVGSVVIGGWTAVDDYQNPNWSVIGNYQDPNWVEIQAA
ncbi:hypothetical protein EBT25_13365 [bacterium]|nr:hypothetical protein [bacterium]